LERKLDTAAFIWIATQIPRYIRKRGGRGVQTGVGGRRRGRGRGRKENAKQKETNMRIMINPVFRRKGNSAERSDCISEHFDGFGSKD
jgi:hypothetical protein